MSRSKAKGTRWESELVTYLRDNGVPHAERRALAGTLDRGDIAGIPGVVIEAKSAARLDLAGWLAEAEAERANDHATYGIVWAKRTGKASPADGYVLMTGAALVQLLTEAGYIANRPAGLPVTLQAGDGLLGELRALVQRHDPTPSVDVDQLVRFRQSLAAERAQWQAELAHLRSLIAGRPDFEAISVAEIRAALRDGPPRAQLNPSAT